jgi:hypothetical protein
LMKIKSTINLYLKFAIQIICLQGKTIKALSRMRQRTCF